MSSRAAAKKVAPVKGAPSKGSAKSAKAAKAAKAAPKKAAPAPKATAKAPAKPAAKAPARPVPEQRPAPLPVPVPAPAVLQRPPPLVAQRPAPVPGQRPAPAPRPPVFAAVLSPAKLPQGGLQPAPLAPPTRPLPKPQPTLARSYFFSDLRVGDDLPTLAKPPVDRVQIARYAVEAHELNRLHLDEPYAASLGYRTVFAPGALAMGFVAQLVSQWLRRGLVRKLQARFVKIVRPGDELTCRGRVAELRREKAACLAELELWAENQKGELVLRGHATCELLESPAAIPGEGGLFGSSFRPVPVRGQPPPPRRPAPPPKPK